MPPHCKIPDPREKADRCSGFTVDNKSLQYVPAIPAFQAASKSLQRALSAVQETDNLLLDNSTWSIISDASASDALVCPVDGPKLAKCRAI
jgi:hypothetical protein